MTLDQTKIQSGNPGLVSLACGIGIIAIVFAVEYVQVYGGNAIALTEGLQQSYQRSALPTLGVTVGGTLLSIIGLRAMLNSWKHLELDQNSTVSQRAKFFLGQSVSKRPLLFWLILIAYALFFGFVSGTFVYSTQDFSTKYGISPPSSYITGCCGQPGAFPILTAYVSEHFGLLITPLNLVLMTLMPTAVALNITSLIYKTREYRTLAASCKIVKNPSIYGASLGVLAGCPTCAAGLFLASAGGTGVLGISFSLLSLYQPAIVLVSISLLVAGPLISELRRR